MSGDPETTGRRRPGVETAVTASLLVTGLVFAGFGLIEYGLWYDYGPGAGFFPFAVGALMAVTCAFTLLPGRARTPARLELRAALPVAAIAVVIGLIALIGMVEALTLFIICWIKLIERRSWREALIAAAASALTLHFVFSVWLGVRFPDSVIPSVLRLWGG